MDTSYYKAMASPQLARVGKRYPKTCNGVCNPQEHALVTDFNRCECLTKSE